MTEEFNPYAAPLSQSTVAPEFWPLAQASEWRRLGTFVVDFICMALLVYTTDQLMNKPLDKLNIGVSFSVPGTLFCFLCYYPFFEGIWARTPGKWIFGTVVVNEAGDRATFTQIFRRSLCRLIPFEPLSIFSARGAWHDRLSNTQVVSSRKPSDVVDAE